MNLSELLLEYEPLQGRDRVWLILYHMYLEESLAQNECCLYNHLPPPPYPDTQNMGSGPRQRNQNGDIPEILLMKKYAEIGVIQETCIF